MACINKTDQFFIRHKIRHCILINEAGFTWTVQINLLYVPVGLHSPLFLFLLPVSHSLLSWCCCITWVLLWVLCACASTASWSPPWLAGAFSQDWSATSTQHASYPPPSRSQSPSFVSFHRWHWWNTFRCYLWECVWNILIRKVSSLSLTCLIRLYILCPRGLCVPARFRHIWVDAQCEYWSIWAELCGRVLLFLIINAEYTTGEKGRGKTTHFVLRPRPTRTTSYLFLIPIVMCNKHITFKKEGLWDDNPRGPDNCLIRTYELHTIWDQGRLWCNYFVNWIFSC